MGSNISQDITPPPLTLKDCLINGRINLPRYYWYRRRQDQYISRLRTTDNNRGEKRKRDYQIKSSFIQRKITRSVKKHTIEVRDSDGNIRQLKPEETLWYMLYVANPPYNKRMHQLFRLRFRMPYSSFINLSDEISAHPIFVRWRRCDAIGEQPSNLKLLLLGALRYIGRGWTLDDIYEANGISVDVNDCFLKCFIEYGSTVLYKRYVIDPSVNIHVSEREKLFKIAGFNGCIGSTDATHIPMLSCPFWASNLHKGFKLDKPARTCNVTVDHSRRILGSTTGHPGTWNDKTLVLFDELVYKVKGGVIPNDFEFTLYEKGINGIINEVVYAGVWFMVDNGYLNWSCTVPPDNNPTSYAVIRFSEWLESMRKDVECLFGIMKGRFCILRHGFRFHNIVNCDKLWLSCCALHNMLLEVDGLYKGWESGIPSDWETMYHNSRGKNINHNITTPFAITRLNREFETEATTSEDNCGMDSHSDFLNKCEKYAVNGKRVVSKMPLLLFRQCLVNHFQIRFERRDITWPKRNSVSE